ncbi:MAG TPA: lactate utilization protein [Clostridia bacterium]|nr:lactate utilization protein [Clostridia bacterium]
MVGVHERVKEIRDWYNSGRVERTLVALKNRGFGAEYVRTSEEAKKTILEMIPVNATIGFGGSLTLLQVGVLQALRDRGNPMITTVGAPPGPQIIEERRRALTSDVFLTGCNAIVEDGRLVNMDGTANRVASLVFGPKRVIVVAGINKIVPDLDSALWRVKHVAAPMNAKRLGYKTPCAETGVCSDCSSPERICNVISIVERRPSMSDITVVLIGEDLGL